MSIRVIILSTSDRFHEDTHFDIIMAKTMRIRKVFRACGPCVLPFHSDLTAQDTGGNEHDYLQRREQRGHLRRAWAIFGELGILG